MHLASMRTPRPCLARPVKAVYCQVGLGIEVRERQLRQEGADRTVSGQGRVSPGAGDPPWLVPILLAVVAIFLYMVRSVLGPFIVAAMLAYILSPAVGATAKRLRWRRLPAVLLVYLLILAPLALLIWVVEPAIARETRDFAGGGGDIVRASMVQLIGGDRLQFAGLDLDVDTVIASATGWVRGLLGSPAEAFHVGTVVVGGVLHGFLTLVLTFYFLLNPRPFAQGILRFVPEDRRAGWEQTGREVHAVLGRYVRGLIFLVALMSTATWLGLTLIFRLPHALPIAVTTGLLEIIPFLGPVLAGTIAAVVGLFYGGANMALWIALFYLVLRQLEDQLVMPAVIGHAVELHPAVTIFAVLAGSALAGVLGALMAIPLAAAIKVALDRWRPARE